MSKFLISVQPIGKNASAFALEDTSSANADTSSASAFALEVSLTTTVGDMRTNIRNQMKWKHCMIVCYGRKLDDNRITLDMTGVPEHKRVVCLNRSPKPKVEPVFYVWDTCPLSALELVKLMDAVPSKCCMDDPYGTKQQFKNKADETALLDLLQQVRVMLRSILNSSDHAPILTATSTIVVDADLFCLYQQKAYALLVKTDLLQPITGAVAKGLLEEVETNAKRIITFGDSKEELPFVALAEVNRQIAARRQFLFKRDELPAIKLRAAEREAAREAAREAGASEVELELYY